MNPQLKLYDSLLQQQLRLIRAGKKTGVATEKLAQALLRDVQAAIAAKPDSVRLTALETAVRQLVTQYRAGLVRVVESEVYGNVAQEWKDTAASLNAALGTTIIGEAVAIPAAAAVAEKTLVAGTPVAEYIEGHAGNVQRDILQQVRLGVAGGQTMPEIIKAIAGIAGMTANAAAIFGSTLTMAVGNHARQSLYEDNSDVISGVVWVATLDNRTCLKCAPRDGKRWELKSKKPIGHSVPFVVPPLHIRCRCVLVPVVKAFDELPQSIKAKIPKGTRASLDGYVPQDLTFEEWIEGKPAEFQKEWFGAGRYELFKAGKITFDGLMNS